MSIPTSLPLFAQQKAIRLTKKRRIYEMFLGNLGQRLQSNALHSIFGSAFRSRVSDINNDPDSQIVIRNQTSVSNGAETSVYWAERKA